MPTFLLLLNKEKTFEWNVGGEKPSAGILGHGWIVKKLEGKGERERERERERKGKDKMEIVMRAAVTELLGQLCSQIP